MSEKINLMIHTWQNGGWVMPALALVAVIAYSTAAHLLLILFHRGLPRVSDLQIKTWVENPMSAPSKLRELIRYVQDEVNDLKEIEGRFREVEAARIPDVDRRLAFANVLVISAPLFGLLGTVLGMLLTFKAIGIGGSSTSDIIAKGISEALVATQTGMMVAIPGLLLTHVAKRWRNEYMAFLLRLEGITLRHYRPIFHGMTSTFFRKKTKPKAQRTALPPAIPEPQLS